MTIIEFFDSCDFNNLTLKEKVSKTLELMDSRLVWDDLREPFLEKFPSCVEILECLKENDFDPDKIYSYLLPKNRNKILNSIIDES